MSPIRAAFTFILGILVASAGYEAIVKQANNNVQREVESAYPVGSCVDLNSATPSCLVVEEVTGIWLTDSIHPANIILKGTIVIELPADANYVGPSQGSLLATWTFPDGSGVTMDLESLKPVNILEGYEADNTIIVITNIKAQK